MIPEEGRGRKKYIGAYSSFEGSSLVEVNFNLIFGIQIIH